MVGAPWARCQWRRGGSRGATRDHGRRRTGSTRSGTPPLGRPVDRRPPHPLDWRLLTTDPRVPNDDTLPTLRILRRPPRTRGGRTPVRLRRASRARHSRTRRIGARGSRSADGPAADYAEAAGAERPACRSPVGREHGGERRYPSSTSHGQAARPRRDRHRRRQLPAGRRAFGRRSLRRADAQRLGDPGPADRRPTLGSRRADAGAARRLPRRHVLAGRPNPSGVRGQSGRGLSLRLGRGQGDAPGQRRAGGAPRRHPAAAADGVGRRGPLRSSAPGRARGLARWDAPVRGGEPVRLDGGGGPGHRAR